MRVVFLKSSSISWIFSSSYFILCDLIVLITSLFFRGTCHAYLHLRCSLNNRACLTPFLILFCYSWWNIDDLLSALYSKAYQYSPGTLSQKLIHIVYLDYFPVSFWSIVFEVYICYDQEVENNIVNLIHGSSFWWNPRRSSSVACWNTVLATTKSFIVQSCSSCFSPFCTVMIFNCSRSKKSWSCS